MNYKFKPSHIVPAYLFIVAVLYGGSKPPSSTNEPPDDISSPTNAPMMCAGPLRGRGLSQTSQVGQSNVASGGPGKTAAPEMSSFLCSPSPSTFTSLTAWNKRGAYCDWLHITFPDGFAFPHGTNLLTGVTLMAYGELRENLHCSPSPSTFALNLPTPVSLVPDESTFSYGLTPSNTFLFSWSNVCVNRDATNRVDASIGLFRNGDMATTVTPLSSPSTSTFAYQPAVPPEGFVGQGQDDAWLAATFSSHFTAITNGGYSAWLSDYIGYNEPNGRYKLSVTIAALPEHGPCYLVCGPYKMVVTHPGTYSFPLTDFEEYDLYTCPVAIPLTYEIDDGWTSPEPEYSQFTLSSPPRRLLGAPNDQDHHYRVERFPEVFIRPNYLTREQAINELIEIRCNAAGIAARDYTSLSGWAIVRFTGVTQAVIEEACAQEDIYFSYKYGDKEVGATLHIAPDWPWWWHEPDPTNDVSNVSNETSNVSSPNGDAPTTSP